MKKDNFRVDNSRSRGAVEKLRVRAERQLKITLDDIIAKGKSIKEEFTVKRERAPRVYYPRSLKAQSHFLCQLLLNQLRA